MFTKFCNVIRSGLGSRLRLAILIRVLRVSGIAPQPPRSHLSSSNSFEFLQQIGLSIRHGVRQQHSKVRGGDHVLDFSLAMRINFTLTFPCKYTGFGLHHGQGWRVRVFHKTPEGRCLQISGSRVVRSAYSAIARVLPADLWVRLAKSIGSPSHSRSLKCLYASTK